MYWEDALDHHGGFLGPPNEFVPWANALHAASWAGHTHLLDPGLIEIDGDVAHSECYVLWMLRRREGTGLDGGGGRYIDRFERRGGEWRIAARELVIDWTVQADGATFSGTSYPTGTWDRGDPSYRRPFAVGEEP